MARQQTASARLDPRLHEWLEQEAERRMTSKSRLVEEAVKEYIQRRQQEMKASGSPDYDHLPSAPDPEERIKEIEEALEGTPYGPDGDYEPGDDFE